ncbi:hypothetical protein DFJ67_3864 [Asanoa ferruginea]|uniref:Uncharacterized protein n=1 Tax=Asanoa ferruginea TaxID=53367 RepID=A0A3D9ZKY2_9ACTN|nr:hypothetical protein DFJ67_3864 [Asanoa ferruginea]
MCDRSLPRAPLRCRLRGTQSVTRTPIELPPAPTNCALPHTTSETSLSPTPPRPDPPTHRQPVPAAAARSPPASLGAGQHGAQRGRPVPSVASVIASRVAGVVAGAPSSPPPPSAGFALSPRSRPNSPRASSRSSPPAFGAVTAIATVGASAGSPRPQPSSPDCRHDRRGPRLRRGPAVATIAAGLMAVAVIGAVTAVVPPRSPRYWRSPTSGPRSAPWPATGSSAISPHRRWLPHRGALPPRSPTSTAGAAPRSRSPRPRRRHDRRRPDGGRRHRCGHSCRATAVAAVMAGADIRAAVRAFAAPPPSPRSPPA